MNQTEPVPRSGDELYAHVVAAIYDALEEIDDGGPAGAIPRVPDTVLVGDGGLSSLAFVNFAVTLEEQLRRDGHPVAVMDIVARDQGAFTVDQLATRIATVGSHAG